MSLDERVRRCYCKQLANQCETLSHKMKIIQSNRATQLAQQEVAAAGAAPTGVTTDAAAGGTTPVPKPAPLKMNSNPVQTKSSEVVGSPNNLDANGGAETVSPTKGGKKGAEIAIAQEASKLLKVSSDVITPNGATA